DSGDDDACHGSPALPTEGSPIRTLAGSGKGGFGAVPILRIACSLRIVHARRDGACERGVRVINRRRRRRGWLPPAEHGCSSHLMCSRGEACYGSGMELRRLQIDDAPAAAALAGQLGYPTTAAQMERRLALLAGSETDG